MLAGCCSGPEARPPLAVSSTLLVLRVWSAAVGSVICFRLWCLRSVGWRLIIASAVIASSAAVAVPAEAAISAGWRMSRRARNAGFVHKNADNSYNPSAYARVRLPSAGLTDEDAPEQQAEQGPNGILTARLPVHPLERIPTMLLLPGIR